MRASCLARVVCVGVPVRLRSLHNAPGARSKARCCPHCSAPRRRRVARGLVALAHFAPSQAEQHALLALVEGPSLPAGAVCACVVPAVFAWMMSGALPQHERARRRAAPTVVARVSWRGVLPDSPVPPLGPSSRHARHRLPAAPGCLHSRPAAARERQEQIRRLRLPLGFQGGWVRQGNGGRSRWVPTDATKLHLLGACVMQPPPKLHKLVGPRRRGAEAARVIGLRGLGQVGATPGGGRRAASAARLCSRNGARRAATHCCRTRGVLGLGLLGPWSAGGGGRGRALPTQQRMRDSSLSNVMRPWPGPPRLALHGSASQTHTHAHTHTRMHARRRWRWRPTLPRENKQGAARAAACLCCSSVCEPRPGAPAGAHLLYEQRGRGARRRRRDRTSCCRSNGCRVFLTISADACCCVRGVCTCGPARETRRPTTPRRGRNPILSPACAGDWMAHSIQARPTGQHPCARPDGRRAPQCWQGGSVGGALTSPRLGEQSAWRGRHN